MPAPIIFGLKPISLMALTMPTESGGYEQMIARSGLVAAMARTIGAKSVVEGGYLLSYTTLTPAALALSRAPSDSLTENSPSAATIATVCGLGFCLTATSKKP